MAADLSFEIADLTAYHLAFTDQPGYWEDYRGGVAGQQSARFEFRPGWQTVYPRTVEAVLVKVELADGTVGWGEANTPIGPEITAQVSKSLLLPMACGKAFSGPTALWDFLYDAQRGRGYAAGFYLDAMAALDIAVWDAVGTRAGLPVAALLADAPRRRLPAYLSGLRQASLAERVEAMREWADKGMAGIKIFLDGDLDQGVAELENLQEAADGCIEEWMVDTLWMCRGDTARQAKSRFGALGARFLECPLQPEDLKGHRELLKEPGAPIALGEHFRTLYQAEAWFESPRALDVYQLDVGRTGLSDGLRQVQAANKAGIPSTPHMGSGLAVFQAATLHFSAVCGGEYLQEYQAGLAQRAALVADTAWQYADGAFSLPDRPGLGVAVDEDKLARYLVKAGA
jgi:D-galactarolactone cycloisomerase